LKANILSYEKQLGLSQWLIKKYQALLGNIDLEFLVPINAPQLPKYLSDKEELL
jgi:hypothetical protein